jgi:hypothetical protein
MAKIKARIVAHVTSNAGSKNHNVSRCTQNDSNALKACCKGNDARQDFKACRDAMQAYGSSGDITVPLSQGQSLALHHRRLTARCERLAITGRGLAPHFELSGTRTLPELAANCSLLGRTLPAQIDAAKLVGHTRGISRV